MLVRSLPTKNKKRLVRDVADTFTSHTGLFMTLLIQTVAQKMAALTVLFFLNIFFNNINTSVLDKQDEKQSGKMLCTYNFYPVPIDRNIYASLVRFCCCCFCVG